MTINLNVPVAELVRELKYLVCPRSVEHALIHVVSAIESLESQDLEQVEHDLNIAHSILKVLSK